MHKKRTIFLTGATGLLGSYLLRIFLQRGDKIYVLARNKGIKTAQERVRDFIAFWDEEMLCEGVKGLTVIEGDITRPNLGLKSKKIIEELIENIEVIYHSAALTKLRAPWEVIKKINVEGSKNVLDFAVISKLKGRLKKINYISTVAVVGIKSLIDFTEDMFELGQKFHNSYEETKFKAEILVREYQKRGLTISIFRPSLVMGDFMEGKTTDFGLFYEPLHFFSKGIFDEFPMDLNAFQNLINIDTVAKAIALLGDEEESDIYHITSPEDTNVVYLFRLAADFFGFSMPELIPLERFSFDRWTPAQKMLAEPFIPYFNYRTRFLSEKTQNKLKREGFVHPKIDEQNLRRVFAYCIKGGFIKD